MSIYAKGLRKMICDELGADENSTPLAGFVGAHMIYRAIYDKMPKSEGITYTNVTAAQINRLGKYTTKCSKALVDTNKLYCFD